MGTGKHRQLVRLVKAKLGSNRACLGREGCQKQKIDILAAAGIKQQGFTYRAAQFLVARLTQIKTQQFFDRFRKIRSLRAIAGLGNQITTQCLPATGESALLATSPIGMWVEGRGSAVALSPGELCQLFDFCLRRQTQLHQ